MRRLARQVPCNRLVLIEEKRCHLERTPKRSSHKGTVHARPQQDTHAVVDQVISATQGRAIYLCVREMGDKAVTSQAQRVLERHPEIVDWTLGVWTKCDLASGIAIRKALTSPDEGETRLEKNGESSSETKS